MRIISTFLRVVLTGGFLAALSFVAPANAAPITWQLTSSCKFTNWSSFPGNGFSSSTGCVGDSVPNYDDVNGNIYSFTTSSKTLKAEAYQIAPVTQTTTQQVCTTVRGRTTCTNQTTTTTVNADPYASTSKLQKDFLGYYGSNGLGVENATSPEHTVDNKLGFDFVVFQLPAAYNRLTITLYDDTAWGTTKNMNATILYGAPTTSLISSTDSFEQKTINNLLAGGFFSTTTTGLFLGQSQTSGTKTITIDSWNPITYFVVAASLSDPTIANFKIKAITADLVVRVPEPATWAAFGTGLLGLGAFAVRRRKAVKRAA
jgi:hypothetical protein